MVETRDNRININPTQRFGSRLTLDQLVEVHRLSNLSEIVLFVPEVVSLERVAVIVAVYSAHPDTAVAEKVVSVSFGPCQRLFCGGASTTATTAAAAFAVLITVGVAAVTVFSSLKGKMVGCISVVSLEIYPQTRIAFCLFSGPTDATEPTL